MLGIQMRFLNIKSRIHIVHIILIQFLPQQFHSLAKPLEMDDFPLPEELDHIIYIRIIGQAEDVIIGHPCLLLWNIT